MGHCWPMELIICIDQLEVGHGRHEGILAEVVVAVDDVGGRVNLVGPCEGDWVSGLY